MILLVGFLFSLLSKHDVEQTCKMTDSENVIAQMNSRKSSGVIFCAYSPQAS